MLKIENNLYLIEMYWFFFLRECTCYVNSIVNSDFLLNLIWCADSEEIPYQHIEYWTEQFKWMKWKCCEYLESQKHSSSYWKIDRCTISILTNIERILSTFFHIIWSPFNFFHQNCVRYIKVNVNIVAFTTEYKQDWCSSYFSG